MTLEGPTREIGRPVPGRTIVEGWVGPEPKPVFEVPFGPPEMPGRAVVFVVGKGGLGARLLGGGGVV